MSYDDWKCTAPEEDDPFAVFCCVCTGHADAPPCSEECDDILQRARREREIDSCKVAIRLVLRIAKAYRNEGFERDERIGVCIGRVRYYRGRIRELRAA